MTKQKEVIGRLKKHLSKRHINHLPIKSLRRLIELTNNYCLINITLKAEFRLSHNQNIPPEDFIDMAKYYPKLDIYILILTNPACPAEAISIIWNELAYENIRSTNLNLDNYSFNNSKDLMRSLIAQHKNTPLDILLQFLPDDEPPFGFPSIDGYLFPYEFENFKSACENPLIPIQQIYKAIIFLQNDNEHLSEEDILYYISPLREIIIRRGYDPEIPIITTNENQLAFNF